MMREQIIHYDLSDGFGAWWRSACNATPKADGSNLTIAENQVTCRDCLKLLGYVVEEESADGQ
jgi:hypothetical protein